MSHEPRKYGLYIPPKKAVVKPSVISSASLFADDDKEKNGVKPQVSVDLKKRQQEVLQEEALKEDPTVFMYDEVVHAPSKQKLLVKSAALPPGLIRPTPKPEAPKPRYINALLEKAAERKSLNEVVKVRLMKKEATLDAEKFQDKEVIVTGAYKRKLEEMKERMEAEDKAVEEDVKRKKDMSGFYGNLLKKNVAFGAGSGGRIREQQRVQRKEDKFPEQRIRYGTDVSAATRPNSEHESEEDEEAFGPVRRK